MLNRLYKLTSLPSPAFNQQSVRTYIAVTTPRKKIETRIATYHESTRTEYALEERDNDKIKETWREILTIRKSIKEPVEFLEGNNGPSGPFQSLFSVPKTQWLRFTNLLDHQHIVEKLNLVRFRYLWPSYNYVSRFAHNPELTECMANALVNYHFLQISLPGSIYSSRFNYYEKKERLISNIESGMPVYDAMRISCPLLPSSFIEKFCYEPNIYLITDFYLTYFHGKIKRGEISSTTLENDYIAKLPSSKYNPKQFNRMLNAHNRLGSGYLDVQTKENLFSKIRHSFVFFNALKMNPIAYHDYLAALENDLLYPEYVRQKMALGYTHAAKEFIGLVDFSNLLTKQISPAQVVTLYARWHKKLPTIGSQKPLPLIEKGWVALCDDQTIDGYHFKCLTSDAALQTEGTAMKHCVGGYGYKCIQGKSHIFSIQNAAGSDRATLEIYYNGNEFILKQNHAFKNGNVSLAIAAATEKFLTQLRNQTFKINQPLGRKGILSNKSLHETGIGLDDYLIYPHLFYDQATQEQIYQAYKNANVLPDFLVAEDYDAAMAKSGLREHIKTKIINSGYPMQKSNGVTTISLKR